jgi:hypothetical protein
MFAATKNSKFDSRSKFQRALDRDAAAVRTQSQEVGLDDGAVAVFADNADPDAPIFGRKATGRRLFEVDLAGEWMRA